MYAALAPLVGILITLMNWLNSRFSGAVGNAVAVLVIHSSGLAAISLILVFVKKVEGGRAPLYCYLGGVVGVGTVFTNNYSFAALGAASAVALALLGQAIASLTADASGFLGRKVRPLTPRRLPAICLVVAGIGIMAGSFRAPLAAILAALASGALPVLSFSLNAELGRRKGALRSTRANYIAGLLTTLAALAFLRPSIPAAAQSIAAAGPLLALSGGIMGVAVVTSMNKVYLRVSAFSATLLVFGGQAATGLALDLILGVSFDWSKPVGILLIVAGLAADAALAPRGRDAAGAGSVYSG